MQVAIHNLGRVGWIIGGVWNQQPEYIQSTWRIGGTYGSMHRPTHDKGREIDWSLASSMLGRTLNIGINNDRWIEGHSRLTLSLPSLHNMDLGMRIKGHKIQHEHRTH